MFDQQKIYINYLEAHRNFTKGLLKERFETINSLHEALGVTKGELDLAHQALKRTSVEVAPMQNRIGTLKEAVDIQDKRIAAALGELRVAEKCSRGSTAANIGRAISALECGVKNEGSETTSAIDPLGAHIEAACGQEFPSKKDGTFGENCSIKTEKNKSAFIVLTLESKDAGTFLEKIEVANAEDMDLLAMALAAGVALFKAMRA